ncbi:MAG: glutamate--tRNA ligase [Candidatus Kuenenbacteria bacterium]
MDNNQIRIRFAPSPTGFLHIGSLRTVLFSYIIAKKLNGKFILRIEDTDQKREVEGVVNGLINILNWTGIKFDEGPHVGGNFGPYIQTQRLEIYKKYYQELLKKGEAYYCFCDEEKLKLMRNEQMQKKLPPRYNRNCRDLKEDEIKIKINNGESFVIRQKMPLQGKVVVCDELRGEIKFNNADLDDHVLIKSNKIPTYQFANVVDDHLMKITHVTRAEEWISSFPKNALLYKSFGWEMPKFIHFPIVLNKEGGKLSKRQGDVAVEDYKEKGFLPEALINFCALMGWHPKGDNEILNLNQIIDIFEIKDMGISSAVFDVEKLNWINGNYIRTKPLDELTKMCVPYLIKDGLIEKNENNYKILATNEIINFDYIKKVVGLEQERMKKLSEIGELVNFFFIDKIEYEVELLKWKKVDLKQILENLKLAKKELERIQDIEFIKENLEKILMNLTKETGVGELLWPLRVALTGQKFSPGPFEIAEILGKKKCLERIEQAIKIVCPALRDPEAG